MIQMKRMARQNILSLYKPPPLEDYSNNYCRLIIVIIISFVFIAAEFVGGFISGSISVISDAFHLVTDLLGFVISFVFIHLSRRVPNDIMSLGYHRMEIIGAMGNLFIIWMLAGFMLLEATNRVINQEFVKDPLVMLIVAGGGLGVNIIMYFILHGGATHSHGLMAEACSHDHQDGQSHGGACLENNQPQSEQHYDAEAQLCDQICDDESCLKIVSSSHCHKGTDKNIHLHKAPNKRSGIDQNEPEEDLRRKKKLPPLPKKYLETSEEVLHQQNKAQDSNNTHQTLKIAPKLSPKKIHSPQKSSHDEPHVHNDAHFQKDPRQDHAHQDRIQEKDNDHVHGDGKKCSHNHGHAQELPQISAGKAKPGKTIRHEGHHHGQEKQEKKNVKNGGHLDKKEHESLSMKAAILHAFSDIVQSVGLLISALIIFFFGSNFGQEVTQWNNWHYLDPISTYLFTVIVILSTVPVAKNCYYIVMESVPEGFQLQELRKEFTDIQGLVQVHDLHIWDLRPGKTLLIAHVVATHGMERSVLQDLTDMCRRRNIYHSTLQVEEQELQRNQGYILCDHNIH